MRRYALTCVVTALWICCLLLGSTNSAHALRLKVKSAIVMDLTTGKVLFEQNADAHIPPASLTKVLTLYLAFDEVAAGRVRLTDKARVSARAAEEGGSTMKLEAGERVEFYELLKGMAVASGNDACVAVAQHLATSVDVFVTRMNRKAKALGMRDSRFVNPNGLPAKGQTTTARDMLTLAASYLQRHPDALKIHSLPTITHNDYTRRNSNHLLGQVEGVDGLKTGYVRASGYNLIATAQRKSGRIVAVILGAATSPVRKEETRKALEAAFAGELGAGRSMAQTAPAAPVKDPASEVVWRVVAPESEQSKTAAAQANPSALSAQPLSLRDPSPQPVSQDVPPSPTPSPASATQMQKAAKPNGSAANHSEIIGHIPTSQLIVKHARSKRHVFEENPD